MDAGFNYCLVWPKTKEMLKELLAENLWKNLIIGVLFLSLFPSERDSDGDLLLSGANKGKGGDH